MAVFGADFIDVNGSDLFTWYASAAEMLRDVEFKCWAAGDDYAVILYADRPTLVYELGACSEITPDRILDGKLERDCGWTREDSLNVAELLSRLTWDKDNEYWIYKEVK